MPNLGSRLGCRRLLIAVALPVVFMVMAVTGTAVAQTGTGLPQVDLNSYYRFPASVGVRYQPLSGIASRYLDGFDIHDLGLDLHLPLPFAPALRPLITLGMMEFAFTEDANAQDWTHRHLYAGSGVSYVSRISREFEVGVDVFGAMSQSVFPSLLVDDQVVTRGQMNAVGGAAVRLALNPSFSTSVSVSPGLRYIRSFGPLSAYDGFSFGVGFSASFRFGDDPDAPQSAIRAVRFTDVTLPSVFAAMQSYYASEPIGSVTIQNTERFPIRAVSVSFFQAGFMDTPTRSIELEQLLPGEQITVPIRAVFNNEVFTTQGITPLTGEVMVSYTARSRPVDQSFPVSYDLYDRNALTWDDDRKVAAFITPSDSAIRNYASHIRHVHRDVTNGYLSPNLQFAIQAYNALAELGMLYQIDPTSPFTEVQGNPFLVDSISLPRETLTRRTGDCDDLTVLFNTLLETVGIPTAFVTTPGHIYSAFNTGVAAADSAMVHPNRDMLLVIDGEIWVLVEVTLIGRSGFMEAWSTGIAEYRAHDANPGARGLYLTNQAQQVFRPVALRETDLGLQYADSAAVRRLFARDIDRLAREILTQRESVARSEDTARAWNLYGIAAAQLDAHQTAEAAFRRVLAIEPANVGAALNLGTIHYLRDQYGQALQAFEAGQRAIERLGRTRRTVQLNLYLNLSKTHYALENFSDAREFFARAQRVDPDQVSRFSYLSTAGAARASEAAVSDPILFFPDDVTGD